MFLAKHLIYALENETPVRGIRAEMRGYSNTGIYNDKYEEYLYSEEKKNMAQAPSFNLPNQNRNDIRVTSGENQGGSAASGNASAGTMSTKTLLIIGAIALVIVLLRPSGGGEKNNSGKKGKNK